MKFGLIFTWSYDLMGVISKLRVENKFTAYHHTTRPEIEQYKNSDREVLRKFVGWKLTAIDSDFCIVLVKVPISCGGLIN